MRVDTGRWRAEATGGVRILANCGPRLVKRRRNLGSEDWLITNYRSAEFYWRFTLNKDRLDSFPQLGSVRGCKRMGKATCLLKGENDVHERLLSHRRGS